MSPALSGGHGSRGAVAMPDSGRDANDIELVKMIDVVVNRRCWTSTWFSCNGFPRSLHAQEAGLAVHYLTDGVTEIPSTLYKSPGVRPVRNTVWVVASVESTAVLKSSPMKVSI